MRNPSQLRFSRLLTIYNPAEMPPVADWKWVSGFRTEKIEPVEAKAHLKHISASQNVHRPRLREVRLTLAGDTFFSHSGKIYRQRPGTVMLYDHGQERDYTLSASTRPFSTLWLHFTSRDFILFNTHSFTKEKGVIRLLPNGRVRSGEASLLIQTAWDQCLKETSNGLLWEYLKSLIASTCLEILATAAPETGSFRREKIISAVDAYIEAHLHEELTLEKVSSIAGYSPYFFHRIYQKHSGRTLKQAIVMARIEKARQLLMENYTVEAVAEAVGFHSVAYFSELFKKHHVGLPPGLWRSIQTTDENRESDSLPHPQSNIQ